MKNVANNGNCGEKNMSIGGTPCSNKAKLLEKNREIKRDEFLHRRTMFLCVHSF